MDALIIVDMQVGLLKGAPKHDLGGVIARINRLAAMVRDGSGQVIFIQHHGVAGEVFAPGAAGWPLLPELDRQDG
ncbi:MAG TPA: isochorismatase family protein, partial [Dongiaceae bacterium]|nr:isochorismatase family protein [Dongiaceae bacterium]